MAHKSSPKPTPAGAAPGDAPFSDHLGQAHPRAGPGARIVSLVPSLTELLCELGLVKQIVGRTGFCNQPRELLHAVPKLGGTKDPDIGKIRALAPTHVLMNVDENRKEVFEELARCVPRIVVTHPQGPQDNPALYRLLGGIFGRAAEAEALCRRFERAAARLARAAREWPRERVLYLVWKAPWITVARDTYVSRFLASAGWDTVPEQAAERYPRINLEPEITAGLRRVLLSTEPYGFAQRHAIELEASLPAGVTVHLVDGSMAAWYGSRAIAGCDYLRGLRASLLADS